MNYTNLPILIVLALSVLGNNVTVSIAALVLLLINMLGFDSWFQHIEKFGISGGVTLLTMAVLVPLVTGAYRRERDCAGFQNTDRDSGAVHRHRRGVDRRAGRSLHEKLSRNRHPR